MFSAGIGIEQMARMLTSENATQRGSTAAAALDAIAAVSRVLSYDLLRYGVMVVEKSATLPRMALESISGKLQQGDGRVGGCLTDVLPAGTFTQPEFMTALGILKDSGQCRHCCGRWPASAAPSTPSSTTDMTGGSAPAQTRPRPGAHPARRIC